jgi:hypothetical protein
MRTEYRRRQLYVMIVAGLSLAACRHSIPVGTTPSSRQAPPTETIVLLMPLSASDAVRVLRRTIFEAGLRLSMQDPDAQWVRVDLGTDAEGEQIVRQWHVLARYDQMPWGGTLISLRAVEHRVTYLVSERTRQRLPGVSRVQPVSNQSRGLSLQAWQRVEQIADALVEKGGEPISEYGLRTATRR